MIRGIFRRKRLPQLLESAERTDYHLKRVLGPLELTMLGVGAIIGAGIFALVGTAAAGDVHRPGAGPALVVSFVFTGAASCFCALCYAELASIVPVAGSAYTYSYLTLGEVVAWVIGWDLILEYAVGNVAVAVSWSGYFVDFLAGFGLGLPAWLTTSTRAGLNSAAILASAPRIDGVPIILNLPAIAIVVLVTFLLFMGAKESSRLNDVLVAIKLGVLIFFIAAGSRYVRPENWTPFAPNGWGPVMTSAGLIFFAYIGFDALSTAAEEARNPGRNVPRAMIASLIICAILYVAVALVLTGMVPYRRLGVPDPLGLAFDLLHLRWSAFIIDVGALTATTAVLLVFQFGQPRIFFAMARDGLLPGWLAHVHPRHGTPYVTTIVTGVLVAAFAGFVDIGEAAELTNIGTLFAFVLVCGGLLVLRRREPGLRRTFRCPGVPLVPLLGMGCCFALMAALPLITWVRFVVWLLIGLIIYFAYGRRRALRGRG